MYFKDKNSTNIDGEFDNKNFGLFNFIKNKKYILLILLMIVVLIVCFFISFNNNNENNISYNVIELIINGEETITIYQGDDYIEPGYSASNSSGDNLTNNVIIESNLNVNVIGEYEIVYRVENVFKTRKVIVVEKPKVYTFIHLNTINNDVNVYLKVGDDYIEPGYKVYSSSGENFDDKVVITGNVDTSKKGNYKLVYSFTDFDGIVISVSRMVIVMDTNIKLTLSKTEYTNSGVEIKISVNDEYFDYMVLPNGSKIKDSTYSYSVLENGEYIFKTYNKKGLYKEKSIKVTNIDKISPDGSCSGSYKGGVSTINVSASDNIGISKYAIDGNSYTSNKITINKEIKMVNIIIYDKAGNTKNISCSLKDENPKVKDDVIYTREKYHDNSINGIRYILYNQADSRWGTVKYPDGATIAGRGCMITSVAVVSSAYNTSITPKTVFDKYRHVYPHKSINGLAGKGFDCTGASTSKDKILSSLSSGNAVVIMVYGKEKGGISRFTSSQHYMALLDYKDNKIFIGNSYSNSTYGKTGWFDKDVVLTSVREVYVCKPTQLLIDKFN